jgi:hypothetical protein
MARTEGRGGRTEPRTGRIYKVSTGVVTKWVRASTKAGALKAVAQAAFTVTPASVDDIVEASKGGELEILDALADSDDPGPVPEAGETAGAERG